MAGPFIQRLSKVNPLPIIYFCYADFAPSFPEADSRGGGVSKDIPTYWLLGVSLEAGGGGGGGSTVSFTHM